MRNSLFRVVVCEPLRIYSILPILSCCVNLNFHPFSHPVAIFPYVMYNVFFVNMFSSWVCVTLYILMCLYYFLQSCLSKLLRRVWRYQRGNQKPYIEDEHATQWPKEYGQKDRQRSTKHTHKIKDRVTRTPLKTKLAMIDNADSGVKRKL